MNLVFVHGLGGGAYSTWDAGVGSELGYWPEKLAEHYQHCCVWTLHYTADIFDGPLRKSKTIDILDKSRWFVHQLVQNDIHEKPIVFVCHSLGGLLVKQALQFSQSLGPDKWRSIWAGTQAVIFLATPHTGSQLANISVVLAKVINRITRGWSRLLFKPSRAIENLEKNNPTLRWIRDWYRYHAPLQGIETMAYAEGRELFGAIVVDMEAANPQIAGVEFAQLSDEDHISIAKPVNSRKTVYRAVTRYVESLEARVNDGRVVSASSLMPTRIALERAAKNRKAISRISGWWWELIRVDKNIEVSFFQIRPHPMTNSVFCGGKHFDRNGNPISEWHSEMADIKTKDNGMAIWYYWKGKRIAGEEVGQKREGFGRFEFDEPFPTADRIDKGSGEFWDILEGFPEQPEYKRVEPLLRETRAEVIRDMTKGESEEKKSRILPMIRYAQ
jgi:hypothetical protein